MNRMLLLDLDGTLLHENKTISEYTLSVLNRCKEKNIKLAISTARGASNVKQYVESIAPDIIISSGGALAQAGNEIIYCCEFDERETSQMIQTSLALTNHTCEITIDTLDKHYWNYKQDPHILLPGWGNVIYTDYSDFKERSLKVCVELEMENTAKAIAGCIDDCDFARFSDGNWYKFTKKAATKSNAIMAVGKATGISVSEMIAFGDDYVDIEMLKLCGTGVAMGNAIEAVKQIADEITLSNEEDGVARWLEDNIRL